VLQFANTVNSPSVARHAINAVAATRDSVHREPVDIAALVAIPLFGEQNIAPVAVEAVVEKPEELEETKLNLVLKGLFTSNSAAIGRAIIANGRDEQLYQVGDEIEGLSQVSLTAVLEDRIQLNIRGKAEVLYLYHECELNLSEGSGGDSPLSSFLEPIVSNERSTIASDPKVKKLSQIIRVVRERDKATGEMVGFRVLPGRDRGGFDKSGLQTNDIITSIDGDKLTDLRSAMSIYRNKRDASEVSLMINRQGNEVSVDIDLSTLP
jgi:general secretion pathway protein C